MQTLISYENGIHALDSGYGRPWQAAIHILVENGRAAIVDTASNACTERVLAALTHLSIGRDCVDYVILTHIHLDHAGGAGSLMQALPQARLVVHPRGSRHMANPSKLMAGTIAVYGEVTARKLYGELLPIDKARIIDASDELVLKLNGRELVCLDTPGHAKHHICLLDTHSGHLFTGDTFGLAYRELNREGRQFVVPTTTPVQFDPEAMHVSIERILSFKPEALYLTHFSQVREIPRLGSDLRRLLDGHVAIALREKDSGEDRHARIKNGIENLLRDEAMRYNWPLSETQLMALMEMDNELSAQGLGVWLDSP